MSVPALGTIATSFDAAIHMCIRGRRATLPTITIKADTLAPGKLPVVIEPAALATCPRPICFALTASILRFGV